MHAAFTGSRARLDEVDDGLEVLPLRVDACPARHSGAGRNSVAHEMYSNWIPIWAGNEGAAWRRPQVRGDTHISQ